MPPHDHRNITNLHFSQHSSPLEINNLAALFHLVIHSATLLLRRCPKFPWAQRGKYHSGIELPARPQKDNPSSWQSPRLRSVLRKQRDVILCNREERMGDKDKVKHKHSLLQMSLQTHAFLTIVHPLDFSDFALGDVLDDILGPVTGIGQGLWCLDFFNFGISHGERNLGHRSRSSAHWRECRACGDGDKKEGDGERTHSWLVVRDEIWAGGKSK